VEFYRDATFALSYGRNIDDAGRATLVQDRPVAQLTSSTALPTGSGATSSVSTSFTPNLPIGLPVIQSWSENGSQTSYNAEWDTAGSQGPSQGGQFAANYTYGRDSGGRLTGIHVHANDGAVFDADQAFSYYPNGQLHTSPEGELAYDSRGLLLTRVVKSGTYRYEYDALGRNTKLTYPDGHLRIQQYDAEGRSASRCYQQPDLSQRCYGAIYDSVGNPVTLTDPEGSDTIEYDALDRVMRVTRSDGSLEQYSYNVLGALKTNAGIVIDDQRPVLGGTGTAAAAIPATYNGQSIQIDGQGKITSLAGLPITFDHRGAVTSVAGIAYKYDAYGRIVEDATGGNRYTYDGANRTGVWGMSAAAGPTDTWVYDGVDQPLEHFDSKGNRQYYELDLAGNVRRLRAPAGGDLGGYRFTAFGQQVTGASAPAAPQGVNALPVRWKGRWLMYSANVGAASAVELYDMRARWWCAQLGAFLSIDSFAYQDANSTLWGWPKQNPMRFSDPSGHFWWIVGGAALGAAADVGYQLYTNGGNFGQVDWGEVGASALGGAVIASGAEFLAAGGIFSGASTSGTLVSVTSWAPQGTEAVISSGRWVMLGGATIRNWMLSGMQFPFGNSTTEYVLESDLQAVPNEFGTGAGACVAGVKQAIGQRVVGGP
jgi:RHS repeat-associated protein